MLRIYKDINVMLRNILPNELMNFNMVSMNNLFYIIFILIEPQASFSTFNTKNTSLSVTIENPTSTCIRTGVFRNVYKVSYFRSNFLYYNHFYSWPTVYKASLLYNTILFSFCLVQDAQSNGC